MFVRSALQQLLFCAHVTAALAFLSACGAATSLKPSPVLSTPAPVRRAPPDPGALPQRPPSENAGRKGNYFLRTGVEMFDFWVRVPSSYSTEHPAGLLVFFHGAGGPPPPDTHGKKYPATDWDEALCDRFNLICLHAEFGDGMMSGQIPEKVEAAKRAIGQLLADYKIIPGRGIASAFSNGGRPLKALLHELGEKNPLGVPGRAFPFSTIATYSAVVQVRRLELPKVPAVNWFSYVGETEWAFERIGADALPLYAQLARGAAGVDGQTGPVDVTFWLRPHIGHAMPKQDMVALVAETFERGDTFLAPFVYTPDFNFPELDGATEAIERLAMGPARRLAAEAAAATHDKTTRNKAERLVGLIDDRAGRVLAAWRELAITDPVLATALYERHLRAQFAGHPLAAEFESEAKKQNECHACTEAGTATRAWLTGVRDFVEDMPRVIPEKLSEVTALYQKMKPTGLHARVLKNFLDVGAGRFASVQPPVPVSIPSIKKVSLDGDGKEWGKVKPLPAPYSKLEKSYVRAAWNAAGLHFFVEVPDKTVEPTAVGEKFRDYLQLWIEKDAARKFFIGENAVELYCGPAPALGEINVGHTRAVRMRGTEEPSTGHPCIWKKTRTGYALEMTVPPAELAPATLAAGTKIGLNFCISDGGEPVQHFVANKRENDAYAIPYLWGAVVLGK